MAWGLVLPRPPRLAPVRRPLGQLPERDHADEDQARDQHAENHLLALLGGIDLGVLLLCEENGCGEERHAGATLTIHLVSMGLECSVDGLVASGLARQGLERPRIAAAAQRGTRLGQTPTSQQRCRRRPGRSVAGTAVATRLRANGD